MSLKDWKEIYENDIENNFHAVKALILSFIILTFLFLYIHSVIRNDFNYEWYLYIFLYFTLFIFWLYYRFYFPKNKKGKTGLVVAIYSESREELKTKKDFIKELKREINNNNLHNYFNVVEIKNHQAENVKSRDDIDFLHKKIKGHIYFYGDIKKDFDGEKAKKIFLDINGAVKHMPIPIPVSKDLSFDFRKLLPKEIVFEEYFNLKGCKATAKIVYLTAKYVVGVASYLSGNPFLAYEMHKNLKNELSEYRDNDELEKVASLDQRHLKKIKNKVLDNLSNECALISNIYFINKEQEKAIQFLNLSFEYNYNNYDAWLLKAIYDFKIYNNPQEALQSIKKAKKFSNNRFEWQYSFAFLHFWLENYNEAVKTCNKIKRQNYDKEKVTLKEVEEFNLELLEKYNKPQLYYWLGYLKYKKDENVTKALEYFEKFEDCADPQSMSYLLKKSNTFLQEIKKIMDIKN